MKNKIIVITAQSESGDDYDPWCFSKRPTDKQLKEFLKKECEQEFDEDDEGPGDFGSYLYLSITENIIINLTATNGRTK